MSLPTWLSSNPIVDPEATRRSVQMVEELAKGHGISISEVPPFEWFLTILGTLYNDNTFDLGGRVGHTGYPDFITTDEIKDSVMLARDHNHRNVVTIKFDIDGELLMNTFFERRPLTWCSCGKYEDLFITPLEDYDPETGEGYPQYEFLVNILSGRSVVLEEKHRIMYRDLYMGKTVKLWKPEPVAAIEPASPLPEVLESLPDGRRVPKVGEIITFQVGNEFSDDDRPIGRTISTYNDIPISPTDATKWKITGVDPAGNCMNVKGSRVHNSNEESHDVPQVYIHVTPVDPPDHMKEYVERARERNGSTMLQCFWFIDFTNGYIRQWEDAAITHSVHDLRVVPDESELGR